MPNCLHSTSWYSRSVVFSLVGFTGLPFLHYVESTRLSKQSRDIDLNEFDLYETVLQFCATIWPEAGIFGPGIARRTYLAPVGMVRNHSYVEYDGIRYGAYEHSSGKGYCYGYVNGQQPARIDRVLHIMIPGQPEMQCTCALVRMFQPPQPEPQFPWDVWCVFSLQTLITY